MGLSRKDCRGPRTKSRVSLALGREGGEGDNGDEDGEEEFLISVISAPNTAMMPRMVKSVILGWLCEMDLWINKPNQMSMACKQDNEQKHGTRKNQTKWLLQTSTPASRAKQGHIS